MDYRIEKSEAHVIIWDDNQKIGLRFQEGESMQRYTSEVIVGNTDLLSTEEGLTKVNDISEELRKYAETIFPNEFASIKCGVAEISKYPIYKGKTDEILRYLTEEEACETLQDEISHNNVTRIEQDEKGRLYFYRRESAYSSFLVQPDMELKKGFIGYFTPKVSDVEYFKDNELLAAQYAVNAGTNYDPDEDVYVSPFNTRWKSTTKEFAERTVILIINDEECTYHFKRIWLK